MLTLHISMINPQLIHFQAFKGQVQNQNQHLLYLSSLLPNFSFNMLRWFALNKSIHQKQVKAVLSSFVLSIKYINLQLLAMKFLNLTQWNGLLNHLSKIQFQVMKESHLKKEGFYVLDLIRFVIDNSSYLDFISLILLNLI